MNDKVPVTLISGFLGSGKTTLLSNILHKTTDLKIGVIVNDMAELNIDGSMVKNQFFSETEEKLVQMQNGCICCTLREDLLIEVKRLVEKGDLDYIVIESSGISEPIPIAQTFTYIDEEMNIDLTSITRLDTLVTVVDANSFWDDYASGDNLLERNLALDETDRREVIDLLIDQIEFANVILLNKVDLLEETDLLELENLLYKLNPEAKIIRTKYSNVPLEEIFNTNLFDFEKASESAGWIKELNGEHTPETEEYGISSFVYRKRRPFHPTRFMNWMENWPLDVVRAKGFFWLATRNDMVGMLSQAGNSVSIQGAGEWVASLPEIEREQIIAEDPELLNRWDEKYGDRITEIVFIGVEMDQQTIEKSLEKCLLTVEEMATDWSSFEDPVPAFVVAE